MEIPEGTNKKLIKRIESDNIILNAAIRVFGKKGFSNASLTDIAKEAGVTQGLISQRFSGKVSILDAIFGRIPTESLAVNKENPTLEDAFDTVIEKLVDVYDSNPEWFEFLHMVYNSSDVPEEFFDSQRRRFQRSEFYYIMLRAQESEIVPAGDVFEYFMIFYQNAFNIIAATRKYKMELPSKEAFYSIVSLERYKREQMRKIERLDAYIDVMTANFDLLCRVDEKIDKFEIIKKVSNHPIIDLMESGESFSAFLNELVENYVVEEDRERLRSALELKAIDAVLDENALDVLVFRVNLNGKRVFHQFRISRYIWDDDEREFLFGFFDIDSGIRTAIAMEKGKSDQLTI